MMKKPFVILFIVILGLVGGVNLFQANKGTGTVIGAIEQSGRRVDIIIHQEKVKNGVVAFFKRSIGKEYTVDAGFIKNDLFGWKWVWGGGFSGCSGQYFPSVTGTPFPLVFGEVKNQEIVQVEIRDKKHKVTKVSKIVGTENNRIWFMFLNKLAGPNFDIVGLSNKGDVLDYKRLNITDVSF